MEPLTVTIQLMPADGGYTTSVTELDGVISQGSTHAEAVTNTLEAFLGCLRYYRVNGMKIPWKRPGEVVTCNPDTTTSHLGDER